MEGVTNLHEEGIVHRDLACRNLLLSEDMRVYVADFGLARWCSDDVSIGKRTLDLHPYRWEAPESLDSQGIIIVHSDQQHDVIEFISFFLIAFSEKSDTFSFGVCMYEIHSGLPVRFFCIAKMTSHVDE